MRLREVRVGGRLRFVRQDEAGEFQADGPVCERVAAGRSLEVLGWDVVKQVETGYTFSADPLDMVEEVTDG